VSTKRNKPSQHPAPNAEPARRKPAKRRAKAAASPKGKKAPRKAAKTAPASRARARRAPDDSTPDDARQFEESEPEPELGIGSRVVPPGADYEEEAPESPPRRELVGDSPEDVEAQIRALEARLDGMIKNAGGEREPPASIREQVGSAAREVVDRLSAPLPLERAPDEVVEAAKELFSSDYYLRQWGRLGMRNRSEEVDDFGLDPTYEARLRPLFDFLSKRYFRTEIKGVENIPETGRCIVVANHSGTLPLDGLMLRAAVRLEHPSNRELRWLTEDFLYYLPFVGAFMNRVGAVRACQENAERLLRKGSLVAVFPEGIKGIGKLYKNRYRLQRFGRGGFIRLCLRTQTPLVPCAIVGAEETNPLLHRMELFTKVFDLPYMPVTPTFPWLGPLGLLPAPTKWRIVFGDMVRFEGYGPEAANDHVLVGRLAERVRGSIQSMLDTSLRDRRSVWLG
jgi:1-acyl-sn-glycerol-3-phosphate acyltransferase